MEQTSTPTLPVILYDGACKLCTAQAERLRRLSRNKVTVAPLQTALQHYPQVSESEALQEIKLITEHRIYSGAEAIVKLINLGYPLPGKLLYPYYLPGLKQLSDSLYRFIARNRYRLFGSQEPCTEGCSLPTQLSKPK